jgi:hypothetical protein
MPPGQQDWAPKNDDRSMSRPAQLLNGQKIEKRADKGAKTIAGSVIQAI